MPTGDGMIGPMPLESYRAKRDFARTPEPEPGEVGDGGGRFVVQRHRATALHYGQQCFEGLKGRFRDKALGFRLVRED